MNILFFIGNGFDINLGMNTRYLDFYEFYKGTISKSIIIKELKEDISSGISNWADLELALGKYTTKLKNLNEFDEVYEDIVNNLADYLIEEENRYDFKKVKLDSLLKDLRLPEDYLAYQETQELHNYRSNWSSYEWNVNIITLNYTRSIEKILDGKIKDLSIGADIYGHNITLRDIHHVHGYTDNRLVLGLNDISQIDNKNFHREEEIMETLIKSKCNQVQKHNIDRVCEKIINESSLICIFGSSIGETDNYWWELIGEQLRKNCKIIIFSKGEEIQQRFGQKIVRSKRLIRNLFLNKTNLSNDEKTEYEANVYVGANTKMFDIV